MTLSSKPTIAVCATKNKVCYLHVVGIKDYRKVTCTRSWKVGIIPLHVRVKTYCKNKISKDDCRIKMWWTPIADSYHNHVLILLLHKTKIAYVKIFWTSCKPLITNHLLFELNLFRNIIYFLTTNLDILPLKRYSFFLDNKIDMMKSICYDK